MIQLNLSAADKAVVHSYLAMRPSGADQGALFRAYGDFRPRAGHAVTFGADAAWARAHIVGIPLALSLPGMRGNVVDVHRAIAPVLQLAFREIVALGLSSCLHRWNGAWNVRQMRTGGAWSLHSWGVAADLDAGSNAQGAGKGTMDPRVVQVFEMLGFTWGGRWTEGVDPMHFQASDPLPGVPVPVWQDAAGRAPVTVATPTTHLAANGARLIVNGEDMGTITAASLGAGKLQVNTK